MSLKVINCLKSGIAKFAHNERNAVNHHCLSLPRSSEVSVEVGTSCSGAYNSMYPSMCTLGTIIVTNNGAA